MSNLQTHYRFKLDFQTSGATYINFPMVFRGSVSPGTSGNFYNVTPWAFWGLLYPESPVTDYPSLIRLHCRLRQRKPVLYQPQYQLQLNKDQNVPGLLFTKQTDIVLQDLMEYRSCEIRVLDCSNRSECGQAPRQQRFRDACLFSERYNNYNMPSCGEASRDHVVRRLSV